MALIPIGDRIKNTKRNSVGIDEFYGPYEADETTNRSALQVAEDTLTSAHKMVPGQTVGVKQPDGSVKEYWVQPKGTTPETYGLVEKGTTDYNDLENKPAIPIVNNGTLTIKQSGIIKGTFEANSDSDVEIDLSPESGEGEGGTTNYNELANKPQIGGVTLSGNKSASDLHLATDVQGTKADNAIPMPSGSDGQILEKDSTATNGVKWSPKPSNGLSAYELYVEEYKTAHSGDATGAMTETEWLASLKGAKGDTGADAVNPFKGLYALDNGVPAVPSDVTLAAVEGDYIYAPDSTNGNTTVVWRWDATNDAWEETAIDVSNVVGVEFANTAKPVAQTNVVNDLTTGGSTDVLSAEMGKELQSSVFGGNIINTESITLSGGYYNTSSVTVGSTYVGEPSSTATTRKNYKCKKVTVNPGETYVAIHYSGYTVAVKSYVKTDLNDIVTEIGGYQNPDIITETFINETETAYNLYLNFYTSTENDWTGQSLTKITTEYTGGAINELKEEVEQEIIDSKLLSGKTILCLGDSITEFAGNDGKRYSDWLAEISNATVINGGFGGSQYRRHVSSTGYGGMDVISVVKAIASGTFPSTQTVGVMQYEGTTEDRVLDGVTNVEEGTKTSDETTRYPDHTKLNVTINDITFSLMVYTYSLDGTTLSYNSDYAGYLTTSEWKTLITSAENVKFTSNDDNRAIVRRLEGVDFTQLYAITLFAGTNDWNIGDASSVGVSGTESDTTTLGAIDMIIRLLNEAYPNVRLFFFTPIVRYRGSANTDENWSDNYISETGMNLRDFSALIFNEVQLNHIPVYDMYNTLGWNRYNFDNFFNSTDGTHPLKGFKWIAETMYRFLISGSNTFGVDNMLAKEVASNRDAIQSNSQNITDIIGFLDVQFPGWKND